MSSDSEKVIRHFLLADLHFANAYQLRARIETLVAISEINSMENSDHHLKEITLVFIFYSFDYVHAVKHELESLGLSPTVNYSELTTEQLASLSPDERCAQATFINVRITPGSPSFWAKVLTSGLSIRIS